MNKRILVLVATGLIAIKADAQNSVSLYGLIDTGLGYIKTSSGNRYGMVSGNLVGDRWGLKGSEDLGGGFRTIFQLENGFDVGTGKLGQDGREFGRQAYVGVTSDKFGTVTLGRQYDPIVDLTETVTAAKYALVFDTPGDVDNNDNSVRVSNAVKYVSANYSGLQFEGLYAFSGVSGQLGQGYTYSGAASYNQGPLTVAAGYFVMTNSGSNVARTTWSSPTSDSIFDSAINLGYATARSVKIGQVVGQYVIGAFTVGASYSNAQYANDGNSTFASKEKYNSGKGFLAYQATPALVLVSGYVYLEASGDTSARYHQASLGADYNLSKRTDLYALAAYQHASGTQRTVSGGTQDAVASIGPYGISGTSSQEMAFVGIRHKF